MRSRKISGSGFSSIEHKKDFIAGSIKKEKARIDELIPM
jgi:hypothetical protein